MISQSIRATDWENADLAGDSELECLRDNHGIFGHDALSNNALAFNV